MSTPRPLCMAKYFSFNSYNTCLLESGHEGRHSCYATDSAEGVAAPLEPLTVPQICIDCGHEFGVWFAENPVWNAIIPGRVGMLCPCCFIVRADKHGFNTTGWKMVPMDHSLGEESIEQVPSPQKFGQAYAQQLNASARQGTVYFIGEHEIKFAEAYAAAVSKNLQEELALTKRVLLQHMNGDDYEMSLAGLYAKLTEND